jgi:hypothetical protein
VILFLTLALLVARDGADDANDTLALDDLALGADGFDAGSNFHGSALEVVDVGFRGDQARKMDG